MRLASHGLLFSISMRFACQRVDTTGGTSAASAPALDPPVSPTAATSLADDHHFEQVVHGWIHDKFGTGRKVLYWGTVAIDGQAPIARFARVCDSKLSYLFLARGGLCYAFQEEACGMYPLASQAPWFDHADPSKLGLSSAPGLVGPVPLYHGAPNFTRERCTPWWLPDWTPSMEVRDPTDPLYYPSEP
jgi:hypothetical protein